MKEGRDGSGQGLQRREGAVGGVVGAECNDEDEAKEPPHHNEDLTRRLIRWPCSHSLQSHKLDG